MLLLGQSQGAAVPRVVKLMHLAIAIGLGQVVKQKDGMHQGSSEDSVVVELQVHCG